MARLATQLMAPASRSPLMQPLAISLVL